MSGKKFMDAICESLRNKLGQLGWNPKEREIVTINGDKVWVVFTNQNHHSFSIQACSQLEAWESAWQLVGKNSEAAGESRLILPFLGGRSTRNRVMHAEKSEM